VDFFERWLHVSPDHGDGSTEMIYLTAAAIGILILIFRRKLTRSLHSLMRAMPGKKRNTR